MLDNQYEISDQEVVGLFSRITINLDIAGIYFVEGYRNLRAGRAAYQTLLESKDRHNRFVNGTLPDSHAVPEVAESLPDILSSLREIEPVFEPVVRHLSLAIILISASVEAYVNEIASVKLTNSERDEFDKLTTVGKWLFLPRVLGINVDFSTGAEPIQGLASLVRTRHKLIHFKAMRQPLDNKHVPDFLDRLGLLPDRIQTECEAVRSLIRKFELEWVGSYGPTWLDPEEDHFRAPCFYLHNRESSAVLYSDSLDREDE